MIHTVLVDLSKACFGSSVFDFLACLLVHIGLLLACMTWNSEPMLGAMVLDRMDARLVPTQLDAQGDAREPLCTKQADP